MANKSFYEYFKESMNSLGLPAPASIFENVTLAAASIKVMEEVIKRLGASATAAEILTATGTTLAADVAVAVTGISAAFYLGACIGALIYATSSCMYDCIVADNSSNVWRTVQRAEAMGIRIPSSVFNEMAYQNIRRRGGSGSSTLA